MKTEEKLPIVFCIPDVPDLSGVGRCMLRHRKILSVNGWVSHAVSPAARGLSAWIEDGGELRASDPPGELIRVVASFDRENLQRSGRKVVLAQDLDSIAIGQRVDNWRDAGVEAVIATSPSVKSEVEARFGIPATVVSPSVDRTVFHPGPKTRSIAFVAQRKDSSLGRLLGGCRTAGFERVPIREISLQQVAEILSRSAIFIVGTHGTTFGLPTLEAMASGCVVVGSPGTAGRDFLEDGVNCLLAPEGDCQRAAELVDLASRLFDEGRVADLTQAALATARRFSPGREAAELLRFWSAISGDAPSKPPPSSTPWPAQVG